MKEFGKTISAWFSKLPPIIQLIVVILAIILIWYMIVRFRAWLKAIQRNAETKSELSVLEGAGLQATYTTEEYEEMASRLYNGMQSDWYNPFDWGTDDSSVQGVFEELENDIDFMKLKAAFGIRDGYSFQQWIDGDLNQGEKDEINSVMASKGMKKRI